MALKMMKNGRLAALEAFARDPVLDDPWQVALYQIDIDPVDSDIDDLFLNNEADFTGYGRKDLEWPTEADSVKEFGVLKGTPVTWTGSPTLLHNNLIWGYFVTAIWDMTPVVLWAERLKLAPVSMLGLGRFVTVNPVLTARSLFHP
jgi:hypothetical protein